MSINRCINRIKLMKHKYWLDYLSTSFVGHSTVCTTKSIAWFYSCLGAPGELGSCLIDALLFELRFVWFKLAVYKWRSSSGICVWFGGIAEESERAGFATAMMFPWLEDITWKEIWTQASVTNLSNFLPRLKNQDDWQLPRSL